MNKIDNPVITICRLIINFVTVWMVVEAGHSLDNVYISLAGWTLLVGWVLGFAERYDSR